MGFIILLKLCVVSVGIFLSLAISESLIDKFSLHEKKCSDPNCIRNCKCNRLFNQLISYADFINALV